CKDCLLWNHESNPFHTIEPWTGRYFKKTSLYDLGLVLHLGHSSTLPCLAPSKVQAFTVININCIHCTTVCFCRCSKAILDHYQLLHARLYAATLTAPQMAATFRFLELFQMLSFMSKVCLPLFGLCTPKLIE
ncbi:hypothetical protein GYMLUDRAFT_160626, partial [Collybiopsis luxurians FD-317 M1]